MEKKKQDNVQIGDIFHRMYVYEDRRFYRFYQVIALRGRGKTKVEVREIAGGVTAFDGRYENVVPIPGAWVSEKTFIKKIKKISGTFYIGIGQDWAGKAYLEPDMQEYLCWSDNGPNMANCFREYHPELAAQLHLEENTRVYATERPFRSMGDDCPALIRYPDGREEKVLLKELLHYEEQMQRSQGDS